MLLKKPIDVRVSSDIIVDDTEDERSEDVLRAVYKTVGQELAEQDRQYAKIKSDRSLLRSLIRKIMVK